jgi:peroxiredoxin
VLIATLYWPEPAPTPPPEGKRIGNKCPEIAGADIDGKLIRLSDHKDKVVLVNFWATWCAPCVSMIPHEREMVESKYARRPFALLGIACDSPERLKEFMKHLPLSWPNIVDGINGPLYREWHVSGYPTMMLVDHNGVIKERWFDGVNPDEVWIAVERAVRAAEGK